MEAHRLRLCESAAVRDGLRNCLRRSFGLDSERVWQQVTVALQKRVWRYVLSVAGEASRKSVLVRACRDYATCVAGRRLCGISEANEATGGEEIGRASCRERG